MSKENEKTVDIKKVVRLVLSLILVSMLIPNDNEIREIIQSWNKKYGHILYIRFD